MSEKRPLRELLEREIAALLASPEKDPEQLDALLEAIEWLDAVQAISRSKERVRITHDNPSSSLH